MDDDLDGFVKWLRVGVVVLFVTVIGLGIFAVVELSKITPEGIGGFFGKIVSGYEHAKKDPVQ